jgi:hypothetical protein
MQISDRQYAFSSVGTPDTRSRNPVCETLIYHSGAQVKKTEMGRTCGTYGGEERCIQGFSGETWWKETTWKTEA